TREDLFEGEAEYDTIAQIVASVRIPVWANGDVDSPAKAAQVLRGTGAAGLMIGRAAQGRPWIFREIAQYLATGAFLPEPSLAEVRALLLSHLDGLYALYGEAQGVKFARKHIRWYCQDRPGREAFWREVSRIGDARTQRACVETFFSGGALAAAA
ncbi:MAG TPA: tRNA-dihydrouridine synthase, partial [Candidatus Binatia bacterium]|nr:tRNA-dihydrouridine synthase [Candidatus Binatia bacterium]